jgi:RNA polymerase sigma-70 factor (ECF subfamily)
MDKIDRPGELDEAELVLRATRRDPEAFGVLYDGHADRMYRYFLRRLRQPGLAEDLAAQVFLQAWRAIEDFRPGPPFQVWLYRIAHNVLVDHLRRSRPCGEIPEDLAAPSYSADPAIMAERLITIERFWEALEDMPPDQQRVVSLRVIEGLSHEEVAAELGKSVAATRVLQHRALARLRSLLDGDV